MTMTDPESAAPAAKPATSSLPPSDPAAQGGKTATSDPFYGKSREEVIRMYEDTNSRLEQAENVSRDLKEFVGRVGMFFKIDEKDGTVNLNEDMVRQYAIARGIIPPPGQAQNNQQHDMPPTKDESHEPLFDDEQRSYMERIIEERLQKAMQSIEPELKVTRDERIASWIQRMSETYPDFSKWRTKVGEYMQKRGFKANSLQDLEEAYKATKAIHGGYVDKTQHEAHVNDLVRTLQMLHPGAGEPPINEAEATTAQLLGLDQQDKESLAANEILFGKQYLTKPTGR